MIKLRPYQQLAINDIKDCFKKNKHILLQAPTGSGKTVIFTIISKLVFEKGKKILIITDRTELLMQAGGSLKKVGLNAFYIQAGTKVFSKSFDCYIAMSQTFRRRIDLQYWKDFLQNIDIIIVDEAHKQEFNYLFKSKLLDNKHVIGFTATPRRSGNMRQLALDYDYFVETISVRELINQGYLVNDDYYGMISPNMDNVEIDRMKGDYKENQMFEKFNTPQLYSGVVKNYKEICPYTKALVFCVNIEHVIRTTLEFQNSGIDARFIVSNVSAPKMPKNALDKGKTARYEERLRVYELYKRYFPLFSGDRKKIFEGFKNTDFYILINAGIATTGYDCPDIETIILNRATASTTLLLQMIGRGSRIAENKTHFNILDFGNNCQRLGYYSEERVWSLWHEKTEGKGLPPLKECGFTTQGKPIAKGGCRRLILASYKICPFCGFKYPLKKIKEIELQSLMYDGQKVVKTKRIKDMTLEELYNYWKIKKHKTAWLWRQLWYKGGINMIEEFGKKYNWSYITIKKAVQFCENF